MSKNDLPITQLDLSVRSVNALRRAGIQTFGALLEMNEEKLLQIRNLGAKSIAEILEKINELKSIPDDDPARSGHGTVWKTVDFSAEDSLTADTLGSLSPRSYNLLTINGCATLSDIFEMSIRELASLPGMDAASAEEILSACGSYLCRKEDAQKNAAEKVDVSALTLDELLLRPDMREKILAFVKVNNLPLAALGLPIHIEQRLRSNGFNYLSDIVFLSRLDYLAIPRLGAGAADRILEAVRQYLENNGDRIRAVCGGDEAGLLDDELIRKEILGLYKTAGFGGLSLGEITERLNLPAPVPQARLKRIIGSLLAEGKLEYCDYRCYRVYGSFRSRLENDTRLTDRERSMVLLRLGGETLESVGQTFDMTRERVRQVVEKALRKVTHDCEAAGERFDEDYFRYFFENYAVDRKEIAPWLGLDSTQLQYYSILGIRSGRRDPESALDDPLLDAGLRARIRNYLNRDRVFVEGSWIERSRTALEEIAVRKLCVNEMSFGSFVDRFNAFLEKQGIEYDESLYYTDAVVNTRKNKLREANYLLWKQNEMLRFYDIEGRDFSELLDGLGLADLENIEISAQKLAMDHPDLMEKYDLQDHYELHNLLRKIIPEGSYHDFHCERTPQLRFGTFDRDSAILDLMIEMAPVSSADLVQRIYEEYGYDPQTVLGSYLTCIDKYYHQGVYSVEQKKMSPEDKDRLLAELDEDFYFIEDIRRIYVSLDPPGDGQEINPYNLKEMGFAVYSRYALRGYSGLAAYFTELLTAEEILDITALRQRFCYVQMFSSVLNDLKRELRIIEFEPNRIIRFDRLERAGVTREQIEEFRDSVDDEIRDGEFFTMKSLRESGFDSELFELGFSDRFYSELFCGDDRFTCLYYQNTPILYKGRENVMVKDFLASLVRGHGSVDVYDLCSELESVYGITVRDRLDPIYKLKGTEIYYDSYLDRLYADAMLYERELEETEERL